jgi:hypothetical protein
MQATSPLLGLRGAASDLTWRFGPVSRLRFHRPTRFLPHRRRRRYPTPAALRLPDNELLRNSSAESPAGSKP